MEILTQLKEWLSELLYRTNDIKDHFQINEYEDKDGYFVYFYTKDNRYYIVAKPSFTKGETYLGCQVSCRKPRAGETQFRGNDLPDGQFNEETWNKIKNAIISYELVKIAKLERSESFVLEVNQIE